MALTWNHYLAILIGLLSVGLFISMDVGPDEYLVTISSILVIGFSAFGLLGQFHTLSGALIKVISMFLIGVFILYMTGDIPDENMTTIIRVGVGVFTLSSVVAYLIFFYLKTKKRRLVENGWLLESVIDEIARDSSDNFQQYQLLSSCKHPESGEMVNFKSQLIPQYVVDKLAVGDVIKVYVDKKKPERYRFDLSEFMDDSVFL